MYYISLDVGTNSVGWCVIDKNGKLIKYKRRNMIGVRLFAAAETAEKCRLNRATRRRYFRRRQRILMLREFMSEMINEIDPNFYVRLDESFLWRDDKTNKSKNIYFNDAMYCDKEFYKDYPTVYHLRNYLLQTEEKVDARLIYLALHHMIKYRGNFLFVGQKLEAISSVQPVFLDLVENINNYLQTNHEYSEVTFNAIEKTLVEKKSNKEKKDEIIEILTKNEFEKKVATEIANAILGRTINLTVLFDDEELQGSDGKALKTIFDEKYEEKKMELQEILDGRIYMLDILQQVYGWSILQKILNGKKYISEAMIDKYNKHHQELEVLKDLFRKYTTKEEFKNFFIVEKNGKKYIANYANYIKGTKRCGETNKKSRENLYKEIKNILDKRAENDKNYKEIVKLMDEDIYLLKINDVCNSHIPYQHNENELALILEKQGKYYPQLKENMDKIMKMFRFRIPYYVGPLNTYKGGRNFSWMKKCEGMENEKIYPWNFEKVVDIDNTAEEFITRMTGYCTYLPEHKVLPKNSLLYERFELLQEINKVTINDRKIDKKDRDEFIKGLFEKNKEVNDEKFRKYLKDNSYQGKKNADDFCVQGYQNDKKFASSLSSYITFKKIFGEITSLNEAMIEEIIYWLTVFEEKTIVKRKILNKYKDKITENQLKQILNLRMSGWGKFSREFLNGIKGVKGQTIIEMLTNEEDERYNRLPNLMQIISFDESISEEIENRRKKYDGSEELLDVVQELPTSPATKRGIWQSMKIIKEIIECMNGEEPEQIFIEFARGEEEKERKTSRKSKIEKWLKKLKEEIVDEYNKKVEEELNKKEYNERLDEEKMYLYFMQNGKCLYSGKKLDINCLSQYEVDHIIPQSLTDDDSLDNKVLVEKIENQDKGDRLVMEYLGEKTKNENVNALWKRLYTIGMISEKKYSNLKKERVDDVLTRGFINRQLVETRQIVKAVANLIEDYYQGRIDVVEIKAALTAGVRNKYTYEAKNKQGYYDGERVQNVMYKVRELNDLHHAHDAYLTALIGMYMQKVYPKTREDIIYKEYKKEFKKYKEKNKKENWRYYGNFILNRFDKKVYDGDGIIWDGEDIVDYMKKVLGYRDIFVSHKLEENTGAFYNETLETKPERGVGKLLPIKKGLDVMKYGGYTGVASAYFVLVKYRDKKKNKMDIVGIPIFDAKKIEDGTINLEAYLKDKMGVETLDILKRRILKYQLIKDENGDMYYLTGDGEIINAKQLVLGKEYQKFNRIIAYLINGKWECLKRDELDKELNEIFQFMNTKIAKEYSGYASAMNKVVSTGTFEGLDLKQKGEFVLELLKLTKANAECPNLKKYNAKLPERMGRKSSFNVKDKITIVDMSVTGMYERSMDYELEDSCN